MNIPGTSMEPPPDGRELDPNAAPAADHDDDEGLVETVKVGDQQMAPVSEVIRYRKEARATKRQLEALQPQIEQARAISAQLEQLQPVLETIQRMTPQQREALATGKLPSPAGTPQDVDDSEARELAEDLGLVALDGTLDIARARKRLDKDNARIERMLAQAVGPVRQSADQQRAAALRQQAISITDREGRPFATADSIHEAYGMLPAELAAQPNVAAVAIGTAMFIDRMKGRQVTTPPPSYGAPVFSEPVSGRRGAAITAEDRDLAKRVGLTDKELTESVSRLQQGGRGVRME